MEDQRDSGRNSEHNSCTGWRSGRHWLNL